MNVLMLTEGGANIGFGHVSRSLSISQAFSARGHTVTFIVKGDETVKNILGETKFKVYNWHEEMRRLRRAVKLADAVFVDSYQADQAVYKKISKWANVPVYLDDTRRLDYPAGVVLNWGIQALNLDYPEKDGTDYLLGTQYVSLRRAFREEEERQHRTRITRIMVTFGGDDSKNLTPKVLSYLVEEHPMVRKNIIIGRAFKNKEEIEAVADKRTQFIKAPDDSGMRAVMMESDIAISSGGQTLYELARTGVPTAAVIVADNQEDSVKAWADSAFCTNAGYWTEDELIDNIAEAIEKLKNTEYREQKSQLGQTLVPGNGGLRIVDYIEKRVKEVT